MQLEELKSQLGKGTFVDSSLILVYKKTGWFICNQYIQRISELKRVPIRYLHEIPQQDVFSTDSGYLDVIIIDKLDSECTYKNDSGWVILCKESNQPSIEIPELEDWMLSGYLKGVLKGLDEDSIREIITGCKDHYQLFEEVDKLKNLSPASQQLVYNNIKDKGGYNYLTTFKIFDFTNAILKRDVKSMSIILSKEPYVDIEPAGLVTILINNFKDVLAIRSNPNASPMTLGMPPAKFNAIKYNSNYYTADQLYNIIEMLTSIDHKLKSGWLDYGNIISYVITHIMSC